MTGTFKDRHRAACVARLAGATELLAYLKTIADAEGRFKIHRTAFGEAVNASAHQIDYRLSMLRIGGAIAGEGKGRARITDAIFLPPAWLVVEDEGDAPPAADTKAGGDYPTCRALGIEPVVHMLHNRTLGGEVGVSDIAITLARIPSLERPLP